MVLFLMTFSDIQWLSDIFTHTQRRAVCATAELLVHVDVTFATLMLLRRVTRVAPVDAHFKNTALFWGSSCKSCFVSDIWPFCFKPTVTVGLGIQLYKQSHSSPVEPAVSSRYSDEAFYGECGSGPLWPTFGVEAGLLRVWCCPRPPSCGGRGIQCTYDTRAGIADRPPPVPPCLVAYLW